MKLLEILEKYWNQILLLITAIGIGLKMVFNFLLKKKEINHKIFQENKIEALIRFYNAYSQLKSTWTKLPIYQIFKFKLTSDEVDNHIQPPLNKLAASIIELQVYFKPDLYKKFKEIETNMDKMNSYFLDIALCPDTNESVGDKANNYTSYKEDIEKKNTAILSEINKQISKKLYN